MTAEILTTLLRYIDVRLVEHRVQLAHDNVTLVEADALRDKLHTLVQDFDDDHRRLLVINSSSD